MQQIHIPYARMNSFMYFFIPNTTSLWNGLPMTMFSYVEALIYAIVHHTRCTIA